MAPGDPHQASWVRVPLSKLWTKAFPGSSEGHKSGPDLANYALTLQTEALNLVTRSPQGHVEELVKGILT